VSDEGRLVAGRYRVIQRIGTGAMGAVWQAQDEVLHRTVAIKQLLLQPGLENNEAEDARQRTMREGRIAARLHHPNAITVFDVVTDDNGQPCLIMEYLASTSLAALLHERKTLPPLEVARIGAQVAAALKEAHAVGIVHRDIKPGNILLATGSGTVKITDFGISRATDDVTVTKTGMIAGTPAYLAPEVAIGGDPGPESDVFSLGSTLYAACEGQPPFGLSENTLSLLHAVAAGQINPPRQSGPLASVLAVLLHPDVRHRPTAEEAEELLEAVSRGETPLGGLTEETKYAPASGGLGAATLGAGAAGAALGAAGAGGTRALGPDEIPAGHSGTLLSGGTDPTRGYYNDQADEGYPAGDFPEDDYDRYSAPRAVPAGAAYHADDYDDGYDQYEGDQYEDDYDEPPHRGAAADEEEPGRWKKPAVLGGIVLLGLVAMGIWLFSPRSSDTQTPANSVPPPTSSSVQQTSEVAQTTEEPSVTESSTNSEQVPSSSHATSSSRQSQAPVPPRGSSSVSRTTPPSSDNPTPSSSDTPPSSPSAEPSTATSQ
jgi:hypothetical protein